MNQNVVLSGDHHMCVFAVFCLEIEMLLLLLFFFLFCVNLGMLDVIFFFSPMYCVFLVFILLLLHFYIYNIILILPLPLLCFLTRNKNVIKFVPTCGANS